MLDNKNVKCGNKMWAPASIFAYVCVGISGARVVLNPHSFLTA